MSAPATALLQALLSGPFVTVSPKGIAFGSANPANYSSVQNDGAQYGPDTSGTTTSGINEAITAVSSMGGGVVYLLPTAVFQAVSSGSPVGITTQIVIPSNVALCSAMYGGEKYGATPVPPGSYINYGGTGAASDAILIQDSTSKCGLIGVALIGSASNALVHREGTRESFLIDCYLDNTNTTGSAIINDAPSTSGNGINNEDNTAARCFFRGVARAIGIGTNDGLQQSNNCTWWDITAELPAGSAKNVVDAVEGGNQQFYNFYSRGGTTGAIFYGGASFKIIGGELANTAAGATGSSTSAQIANISGGDWLFKGLTLTEGSITTSGGTIRFEGVKVNTPPGVTPTYSVGPVTIAGGPCFISRDCDFSGLTKTSTGLVVGSGADIYLEPQFPLWDPAAVIHLPTTGIVHPSDPANPSIAAYQPKAVTWVGGPPTSTYTNNGRNLQMFLMENNGSLVSTVSLNGSTTGLSASGPWFLVLRYKDIVAVTVNTGGTVPSAATYDVS